MTEEEKSNSAEAASGESRAASEPRYVGNAWMESDGTIQMHLFAVGPQASGSGLISYAPGSKDYQLILDHIGGLAVGETKAVPAWEKC